MTPLKNPLPADFREHLPTAATGRFPYKHRSIAEIETDAEWQELLDRKPVNRGGGTADWIDRTVGLPFDHARNTAQYGKRSTMPDTSCPNCGARGWCGHNGRTPQ